MSVVSGVTLQVGVMDDDNGALKEIEGWLINHRFSPMSDLTDHYAGTKHPQILIFGAGYNFFQEDEFSEYVLSRSWEEPGNIVLIINPENGPSRVFRPSYR